MTLARGEQTDQIEFGRIFTNDAARKRFWDAVLSTAPTPPLSDEALLG